MHNPRPPSRLTTRSSVMRARKAPTKEQKFAKPTPAGRLSTHSCVHFPTCVSPLCFSCSMEERSADGTDGCDPCLECCVQACSTGILVSWSNVDDRTMAGCSSPSRCALM